MIDTTGALWSDAVCPQILNDKVQGTAARGEQTMEPLFVEFNIDKLKCIDEGDGSGDAEPYLWIVFFKFDGDTVVVDNTNGFMLKGTATVIGTPGDHGNLGVAEVD